MGQPTPVASSLAAAMASVFEDHWPLDSYDYDDDDDEPPFGNISTHRFSTGSEGYYIAPELTDARVQAALPEHMSEKVYDDDLVTKGNISASIHDVHGDLPHQGPKLLKRLLKGLKKLHKSPQPEVTLAIPTPLAMPRNMRPRSIVGSWNPNQFVLTAEHVPISGLPKAWTNNHDRAICIMDKSDCSLDRIISQLRYDFPALRGSYLTAGMIQRRLLVLDQQPEIDYFRTPEKAQPTVRRFSYTSKAMQARRASVPIPEEPEDELELPSPSSSTRPRKSDIILGIVESPPRPRPVSMVELPVVERTPVELSPRPNGDLALRRAKTSVIRKPVPVRKGEPMQNGGPEADGFVKRMAKRLSWQPEGMALMPMW